MEILKNYLENMFMNLPRTEEVMKAKNELLYMMEDKYNELKAEGKTENEAIGTVISEFGNLEELADELGIAGWVGSNSGFQGFTKENTDQKTQVQTVSFQQCREYIELMKSCGAKIAIGVALCICSPIVLVFLAGMQSAGMGISDGIMASVGVTILLCMVAAAVAIFIVQGMKLSGFEHYKKEIFQLEAGTVDYLKNERSQRSGNITAKIAVGVVLCILGVVPLIMAGGLFEDNDFICCAAVCFLLFIVAIAVFLFVTAGMEDSAYKVLLQEADYTVQRKKADTLVDRIASVYWPMIVCIYLLWSFISGDWGITWIIWPVAGVLFGAIAGICAVINNVKE